MYFLRNGVKLHFYSLGTIFEEYMRVSRGAQLLGSGFPIGARSSPVGTRFSFGKSSVLWFRVENTHEAIISREVFEQVQTQIASRRRQQKDATTQIFAGLVRCADCGWSMSFGTNKQNSKPYSYFNCTSYRQLGKVSGVCSAHYIRYDYLYTYVLSRIQDLSR